MHQIASASSPPTIDIGALNPFDLLPIPASWKAQYWLGPVPS
jgi:hypothetical protein